MKKLISLALAALLLLNLAACGESSVSNPSGSSGDSSSSADPAQPDAFSPVTTEAEVRALYGDDASLITSIEAYQGDFLVQLGTDDSCPSLDWVYGERAQGDMTQFAKVVFRHAANSGHRIAMLPE